MKKVTVDPEPYNNRRSRDYISYRSKELKGIFGRHTDGIDRDKMKSLAYVLLLKLDALDCISDPISFRDRHSFQMEIITNITRNLGVYMVVPQRYGHESRNIIASSLSAFMLRIERYRHGHKLPFKSRYPLSKKEFGYLIDFIDNSTYIWTLADYWVKRYHKRVRFGYCDKL